MIPYGEGIADPVAAAGPGGVFYHAQLTYSSLTGAGIAVSKSRDGGATWTEPVNAVAGISVSPDKEWLAVDNSSGPGRGNVYLSWTGFEPQTGGSIYFSRSTDSGGTWSAARRIVSPTQASGFVQGSMIAVGPASEIYVVCYDSASTSILVVKSMDAGQSFSQAQKAIENASLKWGKIFTGGFESPPFPSIAVDGSAGPARGTVYVTVDLVPEGANESDVVLLRSVDGGATWSAPLRVNDDRTNTDQFQPSVAVAPNGAVGVMWYDRRHDPENNLLHDVYFALSADAGASFAPNRRVTSGSWMALPTSLAIRPNYHGDYNQIAASNLGFVMSWADERSGTDPDVFATILPLPEAAKLGPDFALGTRTASVNVLTGSSTSLSAVLSAWGGFSGTVALDAGPLAPGLNIQFSPGSLTAGRDSVVTLSAAPGTVPGTYPVSLIGKSGALSRSLSLRLTVYDSGELARTPRAVGNLRNTFYRPRAAYDGEGNLHVVSAGDPSRFGAPFRALIYSRFRGSEQTASTTVARVSQLAESISGHSIGVDNSGRITVTWVQSNSTSGIGNLFLSRSTDQGKTFSTPANVTGVTDRAVSVTSALLAVSKAGTVDIGYVQNVPPPAGSFTSTRDYGFIRSTDGGNSFSQKVKILNTTQQVGAVYSSSLAHDAAGNPVFVSDLSLRSGTGTGATTTFGIFASVSKDGATFQPPVNLSNAGPSGTTWTPSLAIDAANGIAVVYRLDADNAFFDEAYFVRSTDGGATFSVPIRASRAAEKAIDLVAPAIGLDGSGAVSWRTCSVPSQYGQ